MLALVEWTAKLQYWIELVQCSRRMHSSKTLVDWAIIVEYYSAPIQWSDKVHRYSAESLKLNCSSPKNLKSLYYMLIFTRSNYVGWICQQLWISVRWVQHCHQWVTVSRVEQALEVECGKQVRVCSGLLYKLLVYRSELYNSLLNHTVCPRA